MMLHNHKVFATSELGKPSHETTLHRCTDVQTYMIVFAFVDAWPFTDKLIGLGALLLQTSD